jgi:long-chain acyl-CoA synthetase
MFGRLDKFGENTALVTSEGEQWSYSRMLGEADRLASHLCDRSVGFVFCKNDLPSILFYVGCLRRRVVLLMLSSETPPDRIKALLLAYRPAFLFGPLSLVEGEWISCKDVSARLYGYSLVKLQNATGFDPISDRLALLMSTSGSTGSPTFVRQSYANLEANAESIALSLCMRPQDRAITTLPLSYTYGLSIVNSHLQLGASLVLNDSSVTDRTFWTLLTSTKANNFGGVPYTYEMLRRLGYGFLKTSGIRYLTQAGGRLRPEWVTEIATVCREARVGFYVMYGQTEASPRMSVLSCNDALERPYSIGRSIPGGMFWVEVDNALTDVGEAAIGELVYSGPNVALGYANCRADLSRSDDFNGVLRTGDLASIDSDGFVKIVGRTKRFVKLFGNRTSLEDIEAYLGSKGIECACVGTDDKLVVYGVGVDESEVRFLVSDFCRVHRSAINVVNISQLPRAESGKIMYSALQA